MKIAKRGNRDASLRSYLGLGAACPPFLLSLPQGEKLSSDEQWSEIVRDFLARMELDPAAYRHFHHINPGQGHDHIHLVAGGGKS